MSEAHPAFYPLREDYMKGGAPSLLADAMKKST